MAQRCSCSAVFCAAPINKKLSRQRRGAAHHSLAGLWYRGGAAAVLGQPPIHAAGRWLCVVSFRSKSPAVCWLATACGPWGVWRASSSCNAGQMSCPLGRGARRCGPHYPLFSDANAWYPLVPTALMQPRPGVVLCHTIQSWQQQSPPPIIARPGLYYSHGYMGAMAGPQPCGGEGWPAMPRTALQAVCMYRSRSCGC